MTVKVIALPGLPPKGDVSDWLARGGTRPELEALVDSTPCYEPDVNRDAACTDGYQVQNSTNKRSLGKGVRRDAPPWPAPPAPAAFHGVFDPASIRRAPLSYAVMSMDSAPTGVL